MLRRHALGSRGQGARGGAGSPRAASSGRDGDSCAGSSVTWAATERPPASCCAACEQLEYRGYDSWGIAVATGRTVVVDKRVGKIGEAVASLPSEPLRPRAHALGDSRRGHGSPMRTRTSTAADASRVIHNGIVSNYGELRQRLGGPVTASGSETDTEVVAHLSRNIWPTRRRGPSSSPAPPWPRSAGCDGLNAIAVLDGETGPARRRQERLAAGAGLERRRASAGLRLRRAARAHAPGDVRRGRPGRAGDGGRGTASSTWPPGASSSPTSWRSTGEASASRPRGPSGFHDQGDRTSSRRCCVGSRVPAPITRVASPRHLAGARDVVVVGCGTAGHAALAAQYLLGSHRRPARHLRWPDRSSATSPTSWAPRSLVRRRSPRAARRST